MNLPRINPQDLNPEDKNRRWKRKDARGSFVDTYWRQGSSKIAKHSEYRDDSRSMRTNSIFESPSIRLGRWRKRHDNTDLSAGGQLTDAILIIVHELINRYLYRWIGSNAFTSYLFCRSFERLKWYWKRKGEKRSRIWVWKKIGFEIFEYVLDIFKLFIYVVHSLELFFKFNRLACFFFFFPFLSRFYRNLIPRLKSVARL